MELFNYKDNCRLCLKTHTEFMKNIFTHRVEGYQDTLVQNVFALFKVELKPHKDYPQFICRKCLTELENILLFKEDLERNQNLLFSLFSAAYPNYIEKNLHTLNYSKDSGTELKSVAVNSEMGIDLKNMGDSEYIRVPVSFLKQFTPQVSLQRAEVETFLNELPEIKEEIKQNGSLVSDLEESVNVCKYCSKAFRSQALVNTHCKEVHKLDEQQKKNASRKRISKGTQTDLAKKIKNNENINMLLQTKQIVLPQMDMENNNLVIKAELGDTPSDQPVDNAQTTEQVFRGNQAIFLQNFNLIDKKEAALIERKQKSTKRQLKRRIFKKLLVLNNSNKAVMKPFKSKNVKNKMVVKPFSVGVKKRGRPRKAPAKTQGLPRKNDREMDILCRSVAFLKRYGWRKLQSSSRRGTPINSDFQHANEATKSVSKKVSPRNSPQSPILNKDDEFKTALKKEGCEYAPNLDTSNLALELTSSDVKIKRSNSVESSSNQNTTLKNTTIFEERKNLKDSPTTSIGSNKNNLKTTSNKNVENAKKGSVIKSGTPTASPKREHHKTKDAISSRTYYDKSFVTKVPIKCVHDENEIIDKQPSLKDIDSFIDLEINASNKETKLSNLPTTPKKSKHLLNNNKLNEFGLKLNHFHAGSIDSFLPSNDLEVKKELRIQLERDESPKKQNGCSGLSVFAKINSEVAEKQSSGSSCDDIKSPNADNVPKRRGRPKKIENTSSKISTVASARCSLLLPERRGRPIKKHNIKDELFVSRSYNSPEKEKVSIHSATNNIKIVKFSDGLKDSPPADGGLTPVSKKRGRPKKNPTLEGSSSPTSATVTASGTHSRKSPVLGNMPSFSDVTKSDLGPSGNTQVTKNVDLSTLQDLNDRYEKSDNIGLRIRLRKTASCESLNSLKYDTQDDENFQIKADTTVNKNASIHLNDVPDEKFFTSLDKNIKNCSTNNISLKDEESTPEKVVNLDLEDKEVEMLIIISDDEEDDFTNGTARKDAKSTDSNLNLEERNLLSRSESDEYDKRNQINRSQTCLPLNKHKLATFDDDLKNDFINLLTSNRQRSATPPIRRRGRPPTKFSPSAYTVAQRSKSTARLLKESLNNRNAQEKHRPRSRSVSQTPVKTSGKELFGEVRKRGRPPKRDDIKNISTPMGKYSPSNKNMVQKQDCGYTSRITPSPVSSKNSSKFNAEG